MSDKRFEWIGFYAEFAAKLLPFKSDRAALIQKIKTVYEKLKIKLP